MRTFALYSLTLALAFSFSCVRAADDAAGDAKATAAAAEEKKTKELVEKQLPSYPLKTCVVGGGELGKMGDVIEHVHKERLVRFCCKGCIGKFQKDPDKYLALIDAAAKQASEEKKADDSKQSELKQPAKPAEPKVKRGCGGCGGCGGH